MSVELYVILHDRKVPTRKEWQGKIDSLRAPLKLDSSYDLRRDAGYLPADLAGEDSGFEFYLEDVTDYESSRWEIDLADRDKVAVFRVGSDPLEHVTALFAAGALAQISEGLCIQNGSDQPASPEDFIKLAREEMDKVFS